MKKIRIGHIGTLHDHSAGKIETLRMFPDVFEIIGVVPESAERWEQIKNDRVYKGLKSMTEEQLFEAKPDAVIVEGFELELVSIAQRCIDNGINVHIDKPAGEDIEAFEKLLRSAKQKNLIVQMAYMYRYNPAVKYALDVVKSGRLGEVYSVEAHMDCEHPASKRSWLGAFKGGMMFFLGCHLIDLIYDFQGTPESIIPYNCPTFLDGVQAKDYGFAVMKYKNGISFAKTCAAEIDGFPRRQLVICGSEGTIEIHPLERFVGSEQDCDMYEVYKSEAKGAWHDVRKKTTFPPFHRYSGMMLDFAAMVRGEKQNEYTYEYELQSQRMILAACGIDVDYKKETVL